MTKPNHIVEPEELMAYLDGELPAEQAIDTAAHVETCRECQSLAADLKEVSEMMMAWEMEAVEPELDGKLEAALGNQDRPRLRKSRVKRIFGPRLLWAGGLAATALIVFAVTTLKFARSPYDVRTDTVRTAAEPPQGKGVSINGNLAGRSSRLTTQPTPAAGSESYAYNSLNSLTTKGYFDSNGNVETTDGAVRIASAGKFQKSKVEGYESSAVAGNDQETPSKSAINSGPMIVRTAELAVTTKEFDKVPSSVEDILKRHHGYVGEMNVNTPTGSARSLTAALRVPADGLDAVLADLKHLGRTEKESQTGEEVTQQYVDLQARLANAKHTEQRLSDILRERTGKLSDVLAVEMQIGRVRGEIERMEAERKNMKNQVDFATLNVTIAEDYKAELKAVPPSTGTQFRNAAVEGYRSLVDGIISVLLWLLSAGPTLLVWAAILFFPVRMLWKKLKPKWQSEASQNL